MMIARIRALIGGAAAEPAAADEEAAEKDLRLAAAALMIETAAMDGDFDAEERTQVALALSDRFALTGDEVQTLMDDARAAAAEASGVYPFTRKVKDGLEAADRAEIVELMWEVALVDGRLDPLEDQLIRRVAGLIGVSDVDRGAARKRAQARLDGDTG